MPIIDVQRRQTEVGRIRLGQKVEAKNKRGETILRPGKLDRLRFTSPTRRLIAAVADLYGGDIREWENQWEVITDTREVPVIVPPQPISQWYETWTGGGCKRRCDGQREILSDSPCLCGPDPAERECKPTTRLNLMLAEVPGLGVWRLESHGYYAAAELGGLSDLFAAVSRPVPARLELQQREVKKENEPHPRHFAVPVLHFDVIPGQVVALEGPAASAVDAAPTPAAIEAPVDREPQPRKPLTKNQYMAMAAMCKNSEQVKTLWADSKADRVFDKELEDVFITRAKELGAEIKPKATPEPEPAPEPDSDSDDEVTRGRLWSQIVGNTTFATTKELEDHFWTVTAANPQDATVDQLRMYLDEQRRTGEAS